MRPTRLTAVFSAALSVALLVSLAGSVPALHADGNPLLTTSVIESGSTQTSVAGFPGVLVNYTDNRAYNMSTLVYVDLANSAGQTVYWNSATCSLYTGQTAHCYVAVSPNLKGPYSATVFATSLTSVPLSDASTFPVSL